MGIFLWMKETCFNFIQLDPRGDLQKHPQHQYLDNFHPALWMDAGHMHCKFVVMMNILWRYVFKNIYLYTYDIDIEIMNHNHLHHMLNNSEDDTNEEVANHSARFRTPAGPLGIEASKIWICLHTIYREIRLVYPTAARMPRNFCLAYGR